MPVQKKFIYFASIIAVLLALVCYNPFNLYFQNDDFIHIPLSAEGKLLQQNSFRPVCDLSIMLDYFIWGKNAWGYHFSNLILHLFACGIFYFFVQLLLRTYSNVKNTRLVSWLVTVLFFIYAMHCEPVLWILGRSAILAAIFSLLFLYFFIRRNEGRHFFITSLCFFVVGLLTYESVWILPAICIVISVITVKQQKSKPKRELTQLAIIVALFIVTLIIRANFIHEFAGDYEVSNILNGNYFLLFKHYTLLFIRNFVPAFINNPLLLAGYICTTAFTILLFFRNKKNVIPVLFLCFMLSLLPYITLGVDTNGTESERFLYFPTMIVCTMFAFVAIQITINIKTVLFTALYILHILTLFIVKENYVVAGKIVQQVNEALKQLPDKKVIIASQVPQAQNGAFVFRQGLGEMIRWLEAKNPDTVMICSQRYELLPLKYPYRIEKRNTGFIECNNNIFNASPDTLLLQFTDDALIIIQHK